MQTKEEILLLTVFLIFLFFYVLSKFETERKTFKKYVSSFHHNHTFVQ